MGTVVVEKSCCRLKSDCEHSRRFRLDRAVLICISGSVDIEELSFGPPHLLLRTLSIRQSSIRLAGRVETNRLGFVQFLLSLNGYMTPSLTNMATDP